MGIAERPGFRDCRADRGGHIVALRLRVVKIKDTDDGIHL